MHEKIVCIGCGLLRPVRRKPLTDRLRALGLNLAANSPEEMYTMVASQIESWKKVVADAKIPQR